MQTQSGTLRADTKGDTIGNSSSSKAIMLAHKSTRHNQKKSDKEMSSFVTGLPYGYDTAFGYTTLIDPKQQLKKLAATSNSQEMEKQDFGLNKAELKSIDLLIEGTYAFSLCTDRYLLCFIVIRFFSKSTSIKSKTKVLGQRAKRKKYHT